MNYNIISESDRRIPRKRIEKMMQLIEEEEEPPESSINIIFVRDNRIKKLNKEFRKVNRPTDVLSFNIDSEPGVENVFGEIYISTDTAFRYAREDGINFQSMLIKLCCHGYLHLLGFDHERDEDARLMKSKELLFWDRYYKC
ncbi:MAG: rRNA maturation RNase YbeY [Candidatus Zixiibacteriota bacterium]